MHNSQFDAHIYAIANSFGTLRHMQDRFILFVRDGGTIGESTFDHLENLAGAECDQSVEFNLAFCVFVLSSTLE